MELQTSSNNPLQGIVQSAPSGVLGVDTDTPLSFDTAQKLRQLGYRFCARYLSLSTPQHSGDLSTQEASDILRAGLALVPIQHVLSPGWSPDRDMGTRHGQAALQNARALGIPPGVNVWCDLEGIAHGTSTQSIIDYCNAWYDAVDDDGAGYVPGLYVGYDVFLNSHQLYWKLRFQHYWSAPNAMPVETRGYQMIQLLPLDRESAGVRVDVDVTQQDLLEDSVQWLASTTSPDV
jgi:hypothetical protein